MRLQSAMLIFMILLALAAAATGAPALIEVKSTLTGVVESQPLVSAGDVVEEGQPLVYVRTALTGSVDVAARSPRAGVVRDVLVVSGQRIERGDLVARIEPR